MTEPEREGWAAARVRRPSIGRGIAPVPQPCRFAWCPIAAVPGLRVCRRHWREVVPPPASLYSRPPSNPKKEVVH